MTFDEILTDIETGTLTNPVIAVRRSLEVFRKMIDDIGDLGDGDFLAGEIASAIEATKKV